ncbi:kunitz-type protease inhibitor 2 isoform X2 [Microcaecilia unicolor]|uniref:Kunitz-type protease inhibitor 2 isoform X2 n=1 Tax=Microcaecilia unicolor TaxID=1415580 RepID=A0A6P7Z6R0_9AMPH|nr:kunitz-type protease inhibitor 2 isoform X2 [Microcaecilia unicolor]
MAIQVLFLGSLVFFLFSPGGQESVLSQAENVLPCSSDDGQSLRTQKGLGLEGPVSSLHGEAEVLQQLEEPSGCAEACCASSRCNLAVVQGGRCYLIDCIFQDKNVCRLVPQDGAIAYQKGDAAEQTITEGDEDSNEIVSSSKRLAEASSIPEHCTLKPKTGPCRAAFPRWYYDMEKKICSRFTYGGCMGNENNYESEKACMDKCSIVSEPEKTKSDKGINFQEYCAPPSDTGPCRAAFPRWYYNISTRTCTMFIYGGCKGNKNNHQSEEVCKERCVAHSDAKEGYDPLHTTTHHSTTAVALAVLLAVMAAILLGAMVVVFVKVTRRNHQESSLATIWSPIDDKECLMKNAYTL